MRTTGVTQTVLDYLLWHHLGDDFAERAHDILQVMTRRYNPSTKSHIWSHSLITWTFHPSPPSSLTLDLPILKYFVLQVYKSHFSNNVNANNLAGLVEQYIWRTDISLTRDITEKNTLSCPKTL